MCLFELWFSLGIYPVVGLLDHMVILFFFLINLFIYLFLDVLGLRCCAQAFPSCSERGPLFVAVRGLLTAVVSPRVECQL